MVIEYAQQILTALDVPNMIQLLSDPISWKDITETRMIMQKLGLSDDHGYCIH